MRALLLRTRALLALSLVILSAGSLAAAPSVPGFTFVPFGTVIGGAREVTTDPAGNVYSMGRDSGLIYKINPAGVASVLASLGPGFYVGPYFDPVSGDLLVSTCNRGPGSEEFYRVNGVSGSVSLYLAGRTCAGGFESDAAGNIYASTSVGGGVIKITPGGAISNYSVGMSFTDGMDFGSGGELYVADRGTNQVKRIPPGGGAATVVAGGFNLPIDVLADSAGNVYVANFNNGVISKISSSGVVSTFGTGFANPDGIAFNPAGDLLISSFGDAVIYKALGVAPVPFFTDALGTSTASPQLTIPSPKYQKIPAGLERANNSTGGGSSDTNNDRPMVMTRFSGYLAEYQFRATVTMTLVAPDLAFFGFGRAEPDLNYFNEPAPSFVFRVHNSWGGNTLQAWPTRFAPTNDPPGHGIHFFGFPGAPLGATYSGPVTLEIRKVGDTLTLSVPATGESKSFTISDYSALMGLDATNSRIFFGSTNNGTVFSDLVIVPGDSTPPVITQGDVTEEATSAAGAAATFAPTAEDDVDGPVPVTTDVASGSVFPIGATTVTATATDNSGNQATHTFTVTVRDTTAPALLLPADQTLEAEGAAGAVATFLADATDAVGVTSLTSSHTSGSTFPLGVTTVTVTASDAAGNSTSASFTITVQDTTPPALTMPASQTLEATGPAGAVATFAASATDVVDGAVMVNCAPASGSTFPVGSTTVTCGATDNEGNAASAAFSVIVRDTTPPVLTLPADISLPATSPAGAVVTYAATATDIVAGAVAVTCSAPSGETFALGTTTVTCTATDGSANASSGSFTVTVFNVPPNAVNDAYSSQWNTTLTVAVPGVKANDSDVNNLIGTVAAGVVTGAAHGTVTLQPNGSFTYTPSGNYSGPDSFTYKLNDGLADSNVATVSLTITSPCPSRPGKRRGDGRSDDRSRDDDSDDRSDDRSDDNHGCAPGTPRTNKDNYSMKQNTALTVSARSGVRKNDGKAPTTIELWTAAAHGTVTLAANGSFVYVPAPGFVGTGTFTYVARGASGVASRTERVTIRVTPRRAWDDDCSNGSHDHDRDRDWGHKGKKYKGTSTHDHDD